MFNPAGSSAVMAPLKGKVCSQFIRCSKPGCRCQGGQLHGPYFYRVWREGVRVQKVYVKADELDSVRAACHAYQDWHHELRRLRQQREQLSTRIQREWRKSRRYLSGA